MTKFSHNTVKWTIFVLISFIFACSITRCGAQDKKDTAVVVIDSYRLITDAIGQLFPYNEGHDYFVRYNEGNWSYIKDSLVALTAVFNKYQETLGTNRGLHSRIQAATGVIISFTELLDMIKKEGDKKEKQVKINAQLQKIGAGIDEYLRLSKLYP